jgi:hypothetical protein
LANNNDNIGHGQHSQIHHQTLAKEKSLDVEELAQMAAIRSQNGVWHNLFLNIYCKLIYIKFSPSLIPLI